MSVYKGYIKTSGIYEKLIVCMFLLVGVLVVGVLTIPFKESVRLNGYITDETIKVRANQSGFIESVNNVEGTKVNIGDKIVSISLGKTNLYESSSLKELRDLLNERLIQKNKQLSLTQARKNELETLYLESLVNIKSQISLKLEDLLSYTKVYNQQQQVFEKSQGIKDSKILSKRELNDIQRELSETTVIYNEIQSELKMLRSELDSAPKKHRLEMLMVDQEVSGYRAELLEIKQELIDSESLQSHETYSPVSGVISRSYYNYGESIEEGDVLVTIIPDQNSFELSLLSESKKIGKIEKGQRVEIRFDSFPVSDYGTYGGTVTYVGKEPNFTKSLDLNFLPDGLRFLIKADLDTGYVERNGIKYALISGTKVDVRVQVGEKKIIAWLFSSFLEPFK